MKNSDLSLILSHAYILGSWFQDDFLLKMGMLIFAGILIIFYITSARKEFELKMMEIKLRRLKEDGKNK